MPRVAPGLDNPPVTEIGGTVPNLSAGPRSPLQAGWQQFTQEDEYVPELLWPRANTIYTRMLAHPQVWALYSGAVLPLLQYDWAIDPNGADAEYAQVLADDLGLPLLADGSWPDTSDELPPIGPGLHRFNFLEHVQEAHFAIAFGHYPFEEVAVIDPLDGLAHLARLAPRHPLTLEEINVEPTGELESIRQQGGIGQRTDQAGRPEPIPAAQLAYYVSPLSDARNRWLGRSWFRPLYPSWLIHPRLMRVDAINHERAGGVPWVKTDERYQGTDLTTLQAMAGLWRVGENGGAALPPGAELVIERPGGTAVTDSMKYHDELMSRAWHEMVRQLGATQTGSYALGQVQEDIESMAREAFAAWFRTAFREHVIEDWWGWNVPSLPNGRRPPHPLLKCRKHKEPSPVPPAGGSQFSFDTGGGGGQGSGPPPVAATASPSPLPLRGGLAARRPDTGRADGDGGKRTEAEGGRGQGVEGQARPGQDHPRPAQGSDGAGVDLPEREVGGGQGRQGRGDARAGVGAEDAGREGARSSLWARFRRRGRHAEAEQGVGVGAEDDPPVAAPGATAGQAPERVEGRGVDGGRGGPRGEARAEDAGQTPEALEGRTWGAGGADGGSGWADGRAIDVRAAASLPPRELRREPFPHEVRAATDYAALDTQHAQAATDAQTLLDKVWLPALIARAVEWVRGLGPGATAAEMAGLTLPAPDAAELVDVLLSVARDAAGGAVDELSAQGLAVPAPAEDVLRARLTAQAEAVARMVADGVALAAERKAAQLAGQGAQDIGQVADEVETYLHGLEHRWEADQVAGAVQQAQNGGRFEVFDGIPDEQPVRFHASELLDAATCDRCLEVDGKEYATLAELEQDYPTGGYKDCRGGPRCRGTGVAVLPGER